MENAVAVINFPAPDSLSAFKGNKDRRRPAKAEESTPNKVEGVLKTSGLH